MPTVIVDCADVRTADEFWRRYLDAIDPSYAEGFGRNLDAFWDAVEAEGPGWPGRLKLVFKNADALVALRTAGGGSFLDALRKIAAEASRIEVQLA